jgi:hypothetical protein
MEELWAIAMRFDIDADFDTKLYEDFVSKIHRVVVYLFGCVGMDWGASAPGGFTFHLRFFFYPPPPPKVKS